VADLAVPAFDVANRLAAALDAANIPYAIGGAIAWGIWADPRGTHDVDLNLFVEPGQLDQALDVLSSAGLQIDRARAHQADREGQVLVGWSDGLRVDLFTPSIPFAWEAMKTRKRLTGLSGTAYYLSAEAISLFKLLFFRPKDILDLEKLVAVQGRGVDAPYVRRWLVDMMSEDDPRVATWDDIVRRHWK
jgi:hypothetical protein